MFSAAVRTGAEFADPDVVRCYAHRPPYPPDLFDRLRALAVGDGRLLDLGCGPGKLAIGLADSFQYVSAIDPSQAMLRVARTLAGERDNIVWTCARAEEAQFEGLFDLAVVGAALHWMRADIVMPKLAGLLRPAACLALVEGDAPADADWLGAYQAHVIGWVEKGGAVWRDPATTTPSYREWIEVWGEESFACPVRQRVADLIEAEHSRATWSRAKMGDEAAKAFDDDLQALLTAHADGGIVAYNIRTKLVYGRPLTRPH